MLRLQRLIGETGTNIPVLAQPCSLLSVPREGCAAVAEEPEVDLGSHVNGYNVQELFSGSVRDALHLFMVCWPLGLGLLLEAGSVF